MKNLLLITLICLSSLLASAQQQQDTVQCKDNSASSSINGSIKGITYENNKKVILPFVGITLYNSDSTFSKKIFSKYEDGSFLFKDIKEGVYTIEFKFIAHHDIKIKGIKITKRKPHVNLRKIIMMSYPMTLDNLEISKEPSTKNE